VAEIGRLIEVDLRKVWKNEAQDFTPWLLDNADALGDALGLDLDLREAEHSVGDFSLDLIGEEINTGNKVIIENQLERSDHRHLGQLLTYAGGTDPVYVVWITDEFREEHRAALDWLNEHTDEETGFFGLEISAVQIANSPIAPQFTVVSSPNNWQKEVRGTTNVGRSRRQEDYLRFWDLFAVELASRNSRLSARKNNARQYMNFAAGTSLAQIGASITQKYVQVGVYIAGGSREENLAWLENVRIHEVELERTLGQPLVWHRAQRGAAARADIYKEADFRDEESWPQEINWIITKLEALFEAIESLGGLPHLLQAK